MRFLLVTLTATLLCVGCAKKQVTKPDTAEASATLLEPAEQSGTEEADPELREAILALRRVHFALDSAELNEASQAALKEAAAKLAPRETVHLYVEGHADEQGQTEYNLTLAEKRAKVVQEYLSRLGVQPERLHVVSYGEEKPLKQGSTPDAYAANRRVDFRLMKGDIEIVVEETPTVD